MVNEMVTREPAELAPLPVSEDVVVLARDPGEMAEAQKGLIAWMNRKVAGLKAELAEAEENLATTKRMKTRTQGWVNVVRRIRNRVIYYGKAQTALEEGYCIIPDLPVQIIAVRTSKRGPPRRWVKGSAHSIPNVPPGQLPAGEGEYVDPEPLVRSRKDADDRWETQAVDFDAVDFPFKVVKPQILKGLEAALKHKLFDEIGVLPGTTRHADPILVGRIKRKEAAYTEPSMTFLIAWWIDTRTL